MTNRDISLMSAYEKIVEGNRLADEQKTDPKFPRVRGGPVETRKSTPEELAEEKIFLQRVEDGAAERERQRELWNERARYPGRK
jgi:hypothetical protein